MDPRRVVSPRGADAATGSMPAEERGESLFREFQRVALALSAERDVTRLLDLIVTKCREVTTADAGSLYLVEQESATPLRRGTPAGPALRFVVAQNDSKPLDLTTTTLALNRASIAGYVALTRTPLNLSDVYNLPPTVEFSFNPRMDQIFDYRTVSMLVVPMVDHSGDVVGVVQLINKKRSPAAQLDTAERAVREAQPFGPRDEEMVTALASLAAVAIQGRQAERTRTELEDEVRQLQKMDAVGRLAGGVAHDFNNLLMVVRGRSELLLHHIGRENPMRRHLELIQQTAERAVALTQQLLTFSRKQVVQPRVIDLNAVVAGVEQMLRRLIGEHLEMVLVVGSGLGRVRADSSQLEQVIMNLVVNARDAMPEGGRLTLETANVELDEAFVRAHMGARAGSYVMLAVSDTGVGMDAATQAHLFEPFFTTKAPGKGTGLGLATVYGAVKQHGGYITVESKFGHGAVFTVYLPRTDEDIERPA
ncbi:MAG: ATP-binding protein, partial [Gemmatimonadales bacterium]